MLRKILISALLLFTVGCSSNVEKNELSTSYDEMLEKAKGSTVNLYGWGGDEKANSFFDVDLAKELNNYDITLNRVGMDIGDILLKLENEKMAGLENGDIDVLWINGENFKHAKDMELLTDGYIDLLPNYSNIDTDNPFVQIDFGEEVNGYEVPIGIANFNVIIDSSKTDVIPTNTDELKDFIMSNKGKFAYPTTTDFTGSAFVRNILYNIVGFENILNADTDKETLRTLLMPGFDYLNEIEPYLWQGGETYVNDSTLLNKMYTTGEIYNSMSYTALFNERNIKEGKFPESSVNVFFDDGNLQNAHYFAIPYNAPNKDGASILINEIPTPKMQSIKVDINSWGDMPIIDLTTLTDDELNLFKGKSQYLDTLISGDTNNKTVSELNAEKISIIDSLWEEEVLIK